MTTLYVDQATGASGASGTRASPYATTSAALFALEATGQPGTIEIEGTYVTSAAITLTSADSGDTIEGGSITAAIAAEAIDLSSASNITITGVAISAADGDGVLIDGGTGNTVTAGDITLAGVAGVEIKDGAVNTTVSDNTMTNLGVDESNPTSAGGVYVHGATNTDVLDDSISETRADGISFADFEGQGGSTVIQGGTIAGNTLTNIGTSTSDSDYGAIYDLGRSDNLQDVTITGNVIEGVGVADPSAHAEGVYLDDRTSGVSITDNTITGLNSNSNAVQIHGGSDNTVTGNTFAMSSDPNGVIYLQQPPSNVSQASGADAPFVNTTISGNDITTEASSPSGAMAYYDGETLPWSLTISGNSYPTGYPLGSPAETDPLPPDPKAMTAAAFMNTEGVNITGGLTSYYQASQISTVEYLGATNVRAGLESPGQENYALGQNGYDSLAQLEGFAKAGIKLDVVDEQIDSGGKLDPNAQLAVYNQLQAADPGAIRFLEGLNEINNGPVSYDGYTDSSAGSELSAAEAYQATIYDQVTSDPTLAGVSVIGFTGFDAGGIGGSSEVAAGAATADNAHIYPGAPSLASLQSGFADLTPAQFTSEDAAGQLVVTEEGYYAASGALTQTQQAQDSIDTYLLDAQAGIAVTYLYADDDGSPYSLFGPSNDTSPTPAATAIHNLNAILSAGDTGAVTNPTAIAYSVSDEGTQSYDMELTETSGASDVVLYNESGSTYNETTTFGNGTQLYDVSVYDPLQQSTPLFTLIGVTESELGVGGDPLILEATPVPPGPKTLYVNFQTGSDAGAGTSASPFADIQTALTDLERLGSPGTIEITGSELLTNAITLTAVDSGDVIIGNPGTGNTPFLLPEKASGVVLDGASNVTLEGFAIASPNGTGQNGVVVDGCSGNTLSGLSIFSMGGDDVLVNNSPSLTLTNNYYGGNGVVQGGGRSGGSSGGDSLPMTQYAAPATSGLLDTPLVNYNWNPQTQLASFLSAEANGSASIEFMGDSTTAGLGGDPRNLEDPSGGYPEETAYWLNQDGVAAQDANFLGNNNNGGDSQVSFTNGGSYSSSQGIAGNEVILPDQGATMTFTPENPVYGDTITTQLFGNYSGDQVQVEVNGDINAGTITVSSDGKWDNDTLTLAQATTISFVTYTEVTPNGSNVNIGGVETGGTSTPAIKVLNSGISGGTAGADNYSEAPGDFGNSSGEVPGTIQLNPSLLLINYGLNDLIYYGDTVSQVISSLNSTITDLQAAGEDVILMSPTPFEASNTGVQAAFVAALQTLAVQDHVGLIDLNTTYGGDLPSLAAAGGISSNPSGVHPDATLYANIGQGIAGLLSQAVKAYA